MQRTRDILGAQTSARIVVVPRSSQWKQQEFLASTRAADLVNLLVVGDSLGTAAGHNRQRHMQSSSSSTSVAAGADGDGDGQQQQQQPQRPYVLYTHRLYTDGLGSNEPQVLTSWLRGQLSRPGVNLFPEKLLGGGFAQHRFVVSAVHQPPFVIKRLVTDGSGVVHVVWDGLEVRLMAALAQRLNFTYEVVEPTRAGRATKATGAVSRG